MVRVLDAGIDSLAGGAFVVMERCEPHNILRVRGEWCLADLGLAKYLEESTSAQTLRDCMSPLYAAPEQWRMEATSRATDVYGLGCVAYALLTAREARTETSRDTVNQLATLASDGMNSLRPVIKRLFEEIRSEAARYRISPGAGLGPGA